MKLDVDSSGNIMVADLDVSPKTFIETISRHYQFTGRIPKSRAVIRNHRVVGIVGKPSQIVDEFSQFLDPEIHLVLNMVTMFENHLGGASCIQ